MSTPSASQRIELRQGDITRVECDAIVNAANQSLLGGGGVDGAIHRAAGPELLAECRALGGCPTGSAKITKGYNLPARHVIHAVGPVYRDGQHGEAALLAGCYRGALELAVANNLSTIAFPAISCGVYGYPVSEAAQVALGTVREFLESSAGQPIERVYLVLFDEATYATYERVLNEMSGKGG